MLMVLLSGEHLCALESTFI